MVDECVSRGLKAPTFTTDGYTVCATFFLPDGYDTMFDNQHVERLGDDTKSDNQRIERLGNDTKSDNQRVERLGGDTKSDNQHAVRHRNDTKSDKDVTKTISNVVTANGSEKSDIRREKFIDLIKNSPYITYDELQNIFGVSRSTISRDVAILTKAHRIKRTGGTFGGKWVVIG